MPPPSTEARWNWSCPRKHPQRLRRLVGFLPPRTCLPSHPPALAQLQDRFVSNSSQLYRSDFFPGLGWMLPRRVWQGEGQEGEGGLAATWPAGYWDDFMRLNATRRGRQCIRCGRANWRAFLSGPPLLVPPSLLPADGGLPLLYPHLYTGRRCAAPTTLATSAAAAGSTTASSSSLSSSARVRAGGGGVWEFLGHVPIGTNGGGLGGP